MTFNFSSFKMAAIDSSASDPLSIAPSFKQKKAIILLSKIDRAHGRDARLEFLSAIFGRKIDSVKKLRDREAQFLIASGKDIEKAFIEWSS